MSWEILVEKARWEVLLKRFSCLLEERPALHSSVSLGLSYEGAEATEKEFETNPVEYMLLSLEGFVSACMLLTLQLKTFSA